MGVVTGLINGDTRSLDYGSFAGFRVQGLGFKASSTIKVGLWGFYGV